MNPYLLRPAGLTAIAERGPRSVHAVLGGKDIADEARPRLRDINFGCPWPLRESPHLESARAHALAWMVDFGLVKDPEANERQYRDWKLAESAAWFYPDATPDGLALVADLMGWYFAPFDDQFDGELGRDPRVSALMIRELIDILDLKEGTSTTSKSPVVLGFADLWHRSRRHMSPAWRQRAAHHWKQYLIGQLGEVVNRAHDRKPDAESHLRQRVATTSCPVLSDLIESASGFEVPSEAWHMPVMYELRLLAAEIISITNDLVSAEKEEAAGDTDNNLLLILEKQNGLSRLEAIDELRRMTHVRFERFLRLEKQVPDNDDVLDEVGKIALRRYLLGLHDMVAGDNEWEHSSGRYVINEPAEPREQEATPAPAAEIAAVPQGLSGAAALSARTPAKADEATPGLAPTMSFPAEIAVPTALLGLGTSAARLFAVSPSKTP